jgi:hypothetical protein
LAVWLDRVDDDLITDGEGNLAVQRIVDAELWSVVNLVEA